MNQSSLLEAKRELLSRSGGIVAFPIAGALYWFVLGVCGYVVALDTWRGVALIGSVMIFPTALLLARLFNGNLFVRDNPLASLAGFPLAAVGLLPFALYFVLDGPAIQLLPLALAIGMSLHFPILGWMYGSRALTFHSPVRTGLALAVWMMVPDGRFTILPFMVMILYLVTAPWVRSEIVHTRIAQQDGPANGSQPFRSQTNRTSSAAGSRR